MFREVFGDSVLKRSASKQGLLSSWHIVFVNALFGAHWRFECKLQQVTLIAGNWKLGYLCNTTFWVLDSFDAQFLLS